MVEKKVILAAAMLAFASEAAHSAECGMAAIGRHKDARQTQIYAASNGVASIFYRANMDVNTDGSPRSYSPQDPRGKNSAFNNMGNAITDIFDRSGNQITCQPRSGACFTRYIETFEASRDAKYDPVGHPRFTTDGIIPWKMDAALGYRVPCTITEGVFKGNFVSQTSISVDPSKSACDQGRYLDSFAFNAVVLPRSVSWSSKGVKTDDGDLVVVRDRVSGKTAFAINGDRGPAKGIGEGTIALTAALHGRRLRGDEPYSEIRSLVLADVEYLTFPADDIRRKVGRGVKFTQSDIDRFGKAVFDDWGGVARLDACSSLN